MYCITITTVHFVDRCWAQEPRERLSAAEIVRKLRNVPYRFDKDTALIDATS